MTKTQIPADWFSFNFVTLLMRLLKSLFPPPLLSHGAIVMGLSELSVSV